ncbi:MAG: hypothetical protein R3B07_01130 [Polyangiaceae bacterium]
MSNHPCESCGMPIESGPYCHHCVDERGELQGFDERLERMIGWQQRQKPELSREEAEVATLQYMARMPAWRDHPRVKSARS